MRTPELKVMDVKSFGGLEIETAELERTPNSWQRLEQFDQFVSGAIRKVRGLTPLVEEVVYDKPITAITRWRRSETGDDPIIVGISETGQLYNLETGAPLALANPEVTSPTFLGQMTGIANATETIKYLVIVNGSVPQKFDGTNVTNIGTPAPTKSVYLAGAVLVQDPALGISVLVSRKYRFTWWNPKTRHESSPSPDSLPDAPVTEYSFISPTSSTHATDAFPYIAEIALDGRFLYDSAPAAPGYDYIRVWATRDGGDVFYLVKPLIGVVDHGGGIVDFVFSNADGALRYDAATLGGPLAFILDGSASSIIDVPNLQFGPTPTGGGTLIYDITTPYSPAPDPILVDPGPDPGENDPPPAATWAGIYQGRLFLVPTNDPSRLVFSNLENFQSFAPDNTFGTEASEYDPIIALDGQYAQLIVGKKESSDQITGVDFTDFILAPLDTQINFVSRRGLIHAGAVMFFLSRQGLMVLAAPQPTFYGKPIRPLTDTIVFPERAVMTVHSQRGIALLYAELPTSHTLFLIDYSQPSPFSTMVLPLAVTEMHEAELLDGSTEVLIALEDGVVYKLWSGDSIGGFQILATATTQPLPQDELQYRKQFRRLRVTEVPRDLVFRCSVDGGPFTPYQDVRQMAPIGLTGLQLVIEFAHADTVPGEIVLSNFLVEYTVLGEARDYGR